MAVRESFVPTRKLQTDTRADVAFTPIATIKSDKIIAWTKATGIYTGHPFVPKGDITFSPEAQMRFLTVFDNFVNIMDSIKERDPSIIAYRHSTKQSIQYRRPVHLTLTVPHQNGLSDYQIKQHCLEPFLDNLCKCHGVVLWLWKAEAQLRGAIHFHLIVDRYLDWEIVRGLWYARLKQVGCIDPKELPLEMASRISWINATPDLSMLRLELGSYYAGNEDPKTGELVYKHDRTKRVRQIEGGAWGSCDRLKYNQLTFWNPGEAFFTELPKQAIESFEVREQWTKEEKKLLEEKKLSEEGIRSIDRSKRKFADCFLFKKLEHASDEYYPYPEGTYCHFNPESKDQNKDFKFNSSKRRIVVARNYDEDIQQTLYSYHFLQAVKCYGTGINDTDKTNRHFGRVDQLMISGDSFFSVMGSGKKSDEWLWKKYTD